MAILMPLTAFCQEKDSLRIYTSTLQVDTAGLNFEQEQDIALLTLELWKTQELLELKETQLNHLLDALTAGTEIYDEKIMQLLEMGAQISELETVIEAIQLEADYIVKRERKHKREKWIIGASGFIATLAALIFR